MLKIDRHTVDGEDVNWHIKAEEKFLKTYEQVASTNPEQFPLASLAKDTLNSLSYLSALEPDSAQICPLLQSSVQAYTTLFRQALSVGEHIQVTLVRWRLFLPVALMIQQQKHLLFFAETMA